MTFTADQEPVEQVLRTAFQEAARGVDPAAGTAHRIGLRARRRRRQAAAASIVAVAAGVAATVAGTVTVGWGPNDDGSAVIQPATPRPVRDTVYGVTVSWLPAGAHRTAGSTDVEGSQLTVSTTYSTAAPHAVGQPDVRAPVYTVGVTRGPLLALDELRREAVRTVSHLPGASPTAVGWTTVHGLRALRVTYPASLGGDKRKVRYSITWLDDGAQLTADATDGGTLAQAARLADGLVVGPSPAGPPDPTRAVTEIRAAVRQSFTGPTPEKALEAVEDGGQLRATLDQAIATHRTQLQNVQVTAIDPVIFLNATEAAAAYELKEPLNGLPTPETITSTVHVVLTPSGWKVQQADFCNRVGSIGPPCPTG